MTFLVVTPLALYQALYADRVHPGVRSLDVELSGYSPVEAKRALAAEFAEYAAEDVALVYADQEWGQTLGALGLRFDVDATVREAMSHGRDGALLQRVADVVSAWRTGALSPPVLAFDEQRTASVVRDLVRAIDQPVANATLLASTDGTVQVMPSRIGRKVDTAETTNRLRQAMRSLRGGSIEIAVDRDAPARFRGTAGGGKADSPAPVERSPHPGART